MSENFHYELGADGVAVITWDIGPDKSMNVLNEQGVRELNDHLDTAIADDSVKGVVITSAKPDMAGGMDLNVIAQIRERQARVEKFERIASWLVPGAAGVIGGRPVLGWLGATLAVATATVLWRSTGSVPDPLAMGGLPSAALPVAAIVLGLSYLLMLGLTFAVRERK